MSAEPQTPRISLAKIVHVTSVLHESGQEVTVGRAGIVTAVYETEEQQGGVEVDVTVFGSNGSYVLSRITEGPGDREWHWPETV